MKYIIANWKMNMDSIAIGEWLRSFMLLNTANELVIIAPPTSHLETVKRHGLSVAAQNIAALEQGDFTGQTSVTTIKEFCKYVIIGHTETNDSLEMKVTKRDLCLKHGLTPIMCFTDIQELSVLEAPGTIVAWEDKGNISKNGQYMDIDLSTVTEFTQKAYSLLKHKAPLLYGGSVNRQNAQKLANIENVSGILVGHASLDVVHFNDLIKIFQ